MAIYHEGELEVQRRAGVLANAERVGRIVRREIPDVAREFVAERPFVILGAADQDNRLWATMMRGKPGLLSVSSEDRLVIGARVSLEDPLARALEGEVDVGLLLIDPATRRRMRVNGRARPLEGRCLEVATREVYSNCPKYIQPRDVAPSTWEGAPPRVERGSALTDAQAAMIATTDTLFLASRHPVAGADVSHRGGQRGFVRVTTPNRLLFPDYQGNMMFNTLGNLAVNPRAGILVVDFENGHTLQLSGRATVVWDATVAAALPGAHRAVEFMIDNVVGRGS